MNFDITNRNDALKMLQYEQKLRYSKKYQDMYDEKLNNHGNPEYIERCMQRETLNMFGYKDTDKTLYDYQGIGRYYENDEEIKNAIQYLRINILKDCPIQILEHYKDVKISTLDNTSCNLSDVLDKEKANIIFAGSIT